MKNKMPTKRQIVDYWEANGDALRGNECRMGADCDEWMTRCWCCGFEVKTERCHIVPRSLGGSYHPSNFVLLCNACHIEAPNVKDEFKMWEFINDNRNIFYFSKEEIEFINEEIKKEMNNVTNHFGKKLNNSTIKHVKERVSKSFSEKYFKNTN